MRFVTMEQEAIELNFSTAITLPYSCNSDLLKKNPFLSRFGRLKGKLVTDFSCDTTFRNAPSRVAVLMLTFVEPQQISLADGFKCR